MQKMTFFTEVPRWFPQFFIGQVMAGKWDDPSGFPGENPWKALQNTRN